MGTKTNPIPGVPGATIVDLSLYRKTRKKAVRKPRRKKVPTYELMICDCGCSDFKFVCASDVEALRHSIICADCQKPPGANTLSVIYDLVAQQMVRR